MSLEQISGGPTVEKMMEVADEHKTIDQMLSELGLVQKDPKNPDSAIPFGAFFFLMFVVFGQMRQNDSLTNIDNLAVNLKSLSQYFTKFGEIKAIFYDKTNRDGLNGNFIKKTKELLNLIMDSQVGTLEPLPKNQFDVNNGSALTKKEMDIITGRVETLKANYAKDNLIGNGAAIDVLNGIIKLSDLIAVSTQDRADVPGGVQVCLPNLWARLGGLGTVWDAKSQEYKDGLVTLKQFDGYTNTMSQISSRFEGVSGVTTSSLQFNENNYNQMMSFYKELLNDWSQMKKAFNTAMGQARN